MTTVLTNGEVYKHEHPIVERKIIYHDSQTGKKMMRVCTPEGTIKRIESLEDEFEEPPFSLNLDVEKMILDARREFSDYVVEPFECSGRIFSEINPRTDQSGSLKNRKICVLWGRLLWNLGRPKRVAGQRRHCPLPQRYPTNNPRMLHTQKPGFRRNHCLRFRRLGPYSPQP